MRAKIYLIDSATSSGRLTHHLTVDREEVLLREITEADTWLVGNDNYSIAKVSQVLQSGEAPWYLNKTLWVAQILNVLIYRPVPINENRGSPFPRRARSLARPRALQPPDRDE
jgi:hypothetical protein